MRRGLLIATINFLTMAWACAQNCQAKTAFTNLSVECIPVSNYLYCVELAVSENSDANGNRITHHWLLGDNQIKPGSQVEHCYATYGEYQLQLVSTKTIEGKVFRDTTDYPINIGDVALIQEIKEDRFKYFFDGSGAFINKDCDIVNYYWDFGDGHYACEMLVNNKYTQSGEYEVRLLVEGKSKNGDVKYICGSKKIQIR